MITVITDAEIEPDPLIEPGTICDSCMLCRKHCPSAALSKEIDGDKVLKIDDYEYRFANKNLWRCAWGEHFDLDLDLEIPEKVDEQVILYKVATYGQRGGEMGQCLKFCVPKNLREFDRSYSKTPMRKYRQIDDGLPESRAAVDKLLCRPLTCGADELIVHSAEELLACGIDIAKYLPGAQSAVTLIAHDCKGVGEAEYRFGASYQIDSLCYDLTRGLEDLSARSLMTIKRSDDENITTAILSACSDLDAAAVVANTVITRKAITPQRHSVSLPVSFDYGNACDNLTESLLALARDCGADLAAVGSADGFDAVSGQLAKIYEGQQLISARDKSINFTPWKPDITEPARHVRTSGEILPGAKSVIVLGLRLHSKVLVNATKQPAEAVGPYCFQSYATTWLSNIIGYRLVQLLNRCGYKAVMTADPTGTASLMASPRGGLPDMFSSRFAAVNAGLGWLSTSGYLVTPEFGIRQRCISIVTDAPLEFAQPIAAPAEDVCDSCDKRCLSSCPTDAFRQNETVEITCGEHAYSFTPVEPRRCDWSRRYALVAKSGFGYLGNPADIYPPDEITPQALADALAAHDPIKKYRPVVAEPCVLNCPMACEQD